MVHLPTGQPSPNTDVIHERSNTMPRQVNHTTRITIRMSQELYDSTCHVSNSLEYKNVSSFIRYLLEVISEHSKE